MVTDSINIYEYKFPDEIIKNSILYQHLSEDNDSENIINIDPKYANFIFDIQKYTNINDIINIMETYRYWMVNRPFMLYSLILKNIQLIKDNLIIINDIFFDFMKDELSLLIEYSKIIPNTEIGTKRKKHHNGYYFDEKINNVNPMRTNVIHYTFYEENSLMKIQQYIHHTILSKDLIDLIEFFDEVEEMFIPQNICLLAIRANSFKSLKYFHNKGYQLFDKINNNYNDSYLSYITNCCEMAVIKCNGKTECLEYCIQNGCTWDLNVFLTACELNNVDCLDVLFKNNNNNFIINDTTLNLATDNAVLAGNLDNILYLISKGHIMTYDNLINAVNSEKKKLNVIQTVHTKLIETGYKLSNDEISDLFDIVISAPEVLNYLIAKNCSTSIDVLKYFYEYGYTFTIKNCMTSILRQRKNMFKFIVNHLNANQITEHIMEYITKYGNFYLFETAIELKCPISKSTFEFIYQIDCYRQYLKNNRIFYVNNYLIHNTDMTYSDSDSDEDTDTDEPTLYNTDQYTIT